MSDDVTGTLAAVGAFFVEPRILHRIIRRHRRLPGLGLEVLHGDVYTLPRSELLEIASASELGLKEEELPDPPVLLPRPLAPPASAAPYWRRVFHARVHQAIGERGLTPAMVRERIHRIGQTEFDEIRFVLRQDDLLLPPRDDLETYTEFAAVFLEMAHFARGELRRTFPTLLDVGEIEKIVGEDVEVARLLPGGGEEKGPITTTTTTTTTLQTPIAIEGAARLAERARKKGNLGLAAVLSVRGGWDTRPDLAALVERLPVAEAERAEWVSALVPVVAAGAAAPPGARTVEVRLLYDLVKAAVDRDRELADVDVLDWVMSFFRRPLVRPLPLARPVRIARHLRHAAAKVARAHLGDQARAHLGELIQRAAEAADVEVRRTMRPKIEAVLDEVGLVPRNIPERVARRKLVAELLDHVVASGFFNLGHVRDSLSRSQLKLPDLKSPLELIRGDALLRADARLERELDGVYHRGEIYLRFLQKLSSVFFGTRLGRFLTLYAILPFVGAYVILQGLQHIIGPVTHKLAGVEPQIFSWPAVGVLTVVLFGLLHSQRLRRAALIGLHAVGRGLHAVFVAAPLAIVRWPPIKALLDSRAAAFILRFVVKPALLALVLVGLAALSGTGSRQAFVLGGAAFLVVNLLLNTRAGAHAEEVATDWLVRAGRHLGKRLLPGLLRLIIDVFRTLLELLDRALYAVDERLRFRKGDGALAVVTKGFLGSVWGVVTYVVRIYVNLLIEPTVNPIKHFPVVTVAGKIMFPLSPMILKAISGPLTPLLGPVAANSFAAANLLVLPGFWGFLVWELKENWRLYDANRPPALGPVLVGDHGETMGALLRPGLHSGTVPKTYARLRRAAWKGAAAAAKHRAALHHVEEAVARFVERELSALLEEAGFPAPRVARVDVGGNRLRVVLEPHAVIAFEEQSGWLLGSLAERGFVDGLPPETRAAFETALAGLYKLAGVDMLREEIAACLPPGAPYDVADEGLVVWRDGYATEVIYRLDEDGREILPTFRGEARSEMLPAIAADQLLYSRRALRYRRWLEQWPGGAAGRGLPHHGVADAHAEG